MTLKPKMSSSEIAQRRTIIALLDARVGGTTASPEIPGEEPLR
jgi:hypothetical protein